MQFINIIYGDDYNDADILLVPDLVCNNLNDIVQSFFDWLFTTKDHGYWKTNCNGDSYLSAGTNEFVKWLSDQYGNLENEEIRVVKKNTKYNPSYPVADFELYKKAKAKVSERQ